MKSAIQLVGLTSVLLLIGAMITFSSAPEAKAKEQLQYDYWEMLGHYQPANKE
ncbi:hypothetical protein [Psychromonas sp. psych-6C06]|uniref:hypothetical protein n=1 Tax=Psychromonas sp. psych-6C06 TaxID=2058089 RepID=UPI00187C3ED2|nr:hypothetical protein [Psychromonas sp. psych-6C06]